MLAGLAVAALALSTWIWERRHRTLVRAAIAATLLYVLQAALGALVVKFNLPGGVVMIHLANALLLLGVLTYMAVQSNIIGTDRVAPARSAAPLAAIAAGATYVLALSGAFVVENSAGAACNAWPLCGGGFQLPAGETAVINVAHRFVALLVVLFVGAAMGAVLRRHRGDRALRISAIAVSALVLLQVAAGALVVLLGLPPWVRALHLSLASALWATVFLVAVLTRSPVASVARAVDGTLPADALRGRTRMAPS